MKFVLSFLGSKPVRVCHICYQYLNQQQQQQQHSMREPAPSYEEALQAPQPLDCQNDLGSGPMIGSTASMITPPINFQPISVQSLGQSSITSTSPSSNANELVQTSPISESSGAEGSSNQATDNSGRSGKSCIVYKIFCFLKNTLITSVSHCSIILFPFKMKHQVLM